MVRVRVKVRVLGFGVKKNHTYFILLCYLEAEMPELVAQCAGHSSPVKESCPGATSGAVVLQKQKQKYLHGELTHL